MKNRFHSRLQSILPSIKACFSMPALLVSAALSWSLSANAATETFNTAGTFNWVCPGGVTSISVAVQGGGGGGGGSTASNNRMGAGGGGGGGAYSPALTVVPGTVYTVVVGAGGTAGPNTSGTGGTGGASSFSDGVLITLTANGGGGGGIGSTGIGGAGGTATGGTVNFSGGNGVNGAAATPPIIAGAGGGGAGTDANGSPGSGATGGAGGAGSPAGGKGANSPTVEAAGIAGAAPGGGGSGGCKGTVGSKTGGAGGRGLVTLTYTIPPNFKADNTDNLDLASSWTAFVPSGGVAEWNNIVLGPNTTSLGSDLTFAGIKISDPGGLPGSSLVTINPGNTLTLGAAPTDIDLSTATQDLTLNADLVMGAANVWDVASGRTATLGGAVSGSASVTKQGAGTAVLAGASTYSGTTTVSGGSLNVSGSLVNASLGSIAVQAGGTLNASGTVTGGTSTALTYGTTAGTSTVNVSSGANLTLGALVGANNASAVSIYNQTGGTVNLNAATTTTDSSGVALLGYGHLNLAGGSIAANSRFSVTLTGSSPLGVARIGGGVEAASLSANDLIAIGRTGGSTGEMTVLSNGVVNYNGTGNNNMLLLGNAANATGFLNIAGGTFSSPVKGISWGNGTSTNGGLGMVNLSAGTLEIGANMVLSTIASGNNRGHINFAGGTVKIMKTGLTTTLLPASDGGFASLSNTIFGPLSNSAANLDGTGGASGVVGSIGTTQDFTGGVTINTNGFASTTISVPLVAPTGYGVGQGNLSITGGSGYVAPPTVKFSNPAAANATPAAGYALVSGGQVTGIVITCPGDYASSETPTVTLGGGGGTGASATVTGTLAANSSGGLTKSGAGTLTLTGANTYTGATVVSGGQLVLSGSGTLAASSGLSVGGGAAFRYLPTTIGGTLATGSLNLADGSLLGLAWDATTANRIAATGAATVGTGLGVAVDMGTGFTLGTSYTILTAASGLDTGNYSFFNLTDYTMNVVKTATSVSVTPTFATPLTGAYWRGTPTVGRTKIWAATDGVSDSNWSATDGGATQGLVPGAGADLFISNTAPIVPATSTVLGTNMTIKSLTIADTTNGMSLDADGNTLTITPGVVTSGILVGAGVPVATIATPVILGADQTWTNDSPNAFTVSSGVSGGFALSKAGSGPLVLPAASSFSGGLTIKGGTVTLGTATSAGAGTLTFDNGGLLSATAEYSGVGALTVTHPVTVATGSTSTNTIANVGSNNVTLNSAIDIATGTTLSLANNNTGTSSLDLGGSALVTGGGSIVTAGTSTGNLVFRGANTYSGGTTLGGASVHVPGASTNGPAGSPTDGVFGTGILSIGNISIRSTNVADTTIGNTLSLDGNLTAITVSSEDSLIFSGPATLTGSRTITSNVGSTVAGKSLTFSGSIGDGGNGFGITKAGVGTLVLSSAVSTFTGPVVVSEGILQSNGTGTLANIGTPSSLGAGVATNNATNAASLVLDGGTYSVTSTNAPVTTDRLFTLSQNGGTLAADNGIAANVIAFSNTAPIAYSGSGARTLTLGGAHPGGADANLFAPQISDAGADVVSLQKTGATTWALTNANTYTGATTITGGILQLGDGTSGNDGTIANTSGVANSGTLVFNRFGSSTAAYPITGTGGVIKLGAGTQTLSGLSAVAGNNYSGTTIIDNGMLAFTTTSPSLTGGLTFGSAAGSTNVGALDLSSTSATFGSLTAQTNLATANTITIGSGQNFQINGAVTVGTASGNTTTRLTANGLGSLWIGTSSTPTNANMSIGIGTGDGTRNNSTLDLSGLSTFYANLGTGTFRVGSPTNGNGGGTGTGSTAILAENSTIQAAAITAGSPDTATQSVQLGNGTNTLNTDAITIVTGGRSNATVNFNDTTGSVTVRGLAGGTTSRANLTMAATSFGTATSVTATFDTTDHDADLMFGTMTLAQRSGSSTSGTGNATANLNFNQGTLNANDLTAGSVISGTGGGNATGTLNLSGGTATFNSITNPLRLGVNADDARTARGNLNISGTANVSVAANNGVSILLGNATVAGGTATGALSLTGGTLTVAGDIIRGTATGTSNATLAINGASAILDMGGNDVTGLTSITYTDGTLKNLGIVNTGMTLAGSGFRVFDQGLGVSGEIQGDISGSGIGLTKQGAGTLVLSGSNSYSGDTTIDSGILSQTSANTSNETSTVTIAASGARLNLNFPGTDTVDKLFIGTTQKANGAYGAEGSGAQFEIPEITGTGTLTVSSGPAGGYDSWKGANAGGQGPELDFDNDGVDNGIEYFMNAAAGFTANPQLNGSNTITWPNGGNIPASAYGTQFVVQTSNNITTWTDVPVGQLTTNTDGPGGSLTYTLTGPAPRFVRLLVTPN